MYVSVTIIPVPANQHDAYVEWAAMSAAIFKRYGCLEVLDVWEDFVPSGKRTDYRKAVDAKEGEKIAVSWQTWPDKETFYASEDKMHADGVLDTGGEPPFDPGRLILGCFKTVTRP